MYDLEARYQVRKMEAERALKRGRWAQDHEQFAKRVKRALEPGEGRKEELEWGRQPAAGRASGPAVRGPS